MGKYIDADLLRKEIEKNTPDRLQLLVYRDIILALIDSLQQEQPDFPITDEQVKEFLATHPKIEVPEKYKNLDWLFKKREQPVLPGIEEDGIPGKDYIPVEWVDACERYGKWEILKKEQPEVDLEKEIASENEKWTCYEEIGFGALYDARPFDGRDIDRIARHFYELGSNERKEDKK